MTAVQRVKTRITSGVKKKLSISHTSTFSLQKAAPSEDSSSISSSRHFPQKSRSVGEKSLQPTVGFLSLMTDGQKQKFDTKIEEKSKLRSSQSIDKPKIVNDFTALKATFPGVPKNIMESVLYRYDGNCMEAFAYLEEIGWEPLLQNKSFFSDKIDVHYTTKYYHGLKPSEEKIERMFAKASCGSYITYFVYNGEASNIDVSFKYCLLYKNMVGDLSEKPIKVPNVPDVVKALFSLTNPIKCSRQTPEHILPFL